MPTKEIKLVWVTANRSFVGGPEIGFTLIANHCYLIPEPLAKRFNRDGFQRKRGSVTMGKERRDRTIVKPIILEPPIKERKKRVVTK